MPSVETLREWLKNCPQNVPPGPSDLSGYVADGIEVCSACAGRLLARGCHLGAIVVPVWDQEVSCEVCGNQSGAEHAACAAEAARDTAQDR